MRAREACRDGTREERDGGGDVCAEVDGRPVAQRRPHAEQQEAHAHVVEGAHPAEPVEGAERTSAPVGRGAAQQRGDRDRLDREARRHEDEAEVVAGVEAVPEGTRHHRDGHPEDGGDDGEAHGTQPHRDLARIFQFFSLPVMF